MCDTSKNKKKGNKQDAYRHQGNPLLLTCSFLFAT